MSRRRGLTQEHQALVDELGKRDPAARERLSLRPQPLGSDACHHGHPRCSTYWNGPCAKGELDMPSFIALYRALVKARGY